MWWNKIIDWFREASERKRCIDDFNRAAKDAFIANVAPVYLKSEISRGNRNYKHSMSNFFLSGFKIKTLSGRPLSYSEVESIGLAIHTNQELMRKLATLGFDTLEICDTSGSKVKDWQLTEIMQIRNW
jgi:hypothetical protein